jgi:hypothetical protein
VHAAPAPEASFLITWFAPRGEVFS